MQIAMIEWEDSCSETGWHRKDAGIDVAAKCITVGFLTCEDNDKVVISLSSCLTTGNIGDTMTIPRGCIKRIRKLKVS